LLLALWLRPPSSASGVWWEGTRGPVTLEKGTEAPTFVLPTVSGKRVDIVDLQGERLAIVFVRPGCPHCDQLEEYLESVSPQEGKRLWLMSTGKIEEVRKMAGAHKFSFPVLVDSSHAVNRAYEISGVPAVYLIDSQGRIEEGAMGMPVVWETIQQWGISP